MDPPNSNAGLTALLYDGFFAYDFLYMSFLLDNSFLSKLVWMHLEPLLYK